MTWTPLTLDDRKHLLAIARDTLMRRLGHEGGAPTDRRGYSTALMEPRGAFVTLNRHHQLRGCIGTFRTEDPLHQVVRHMALAAALHDPRFPPVLARELGALTIEISALTPLEPVTDVEAIQVGTHGIFITRGNNRGVLLPQVAVEWGWNRDEFLAETCVKAGLPRHTWKEPETTIEIFGAEVFSESDPAGSAR